MAEEPAVPVEKVDPKEETTTSLPQERLVPAPELTSGAEWPWKKVGGSPAAESTNVEVVEGPLTFQKALWDRFDFVWKQRVEPSQGQLQKLCDVLKARADLERKYGESLLGLGETFNPEPGNSLHAAREAMIVNFRNRGEQSIALADELEQDIIVSFECVIKQHNEVSKRIYSDVQLLLKHLQDKKKAHDKSARRYGSRCVEAESTSQDCLQAVSMKTPERLKLAQQATILSKQARVAEYDYYHAIDQANRAQHFYEQQMTHVLEVLQDMEEKRGQCVRDSLRKLAVYETSWLRNMQYDLEGVAKAAEDCDPVKELQNFIDAASKEVSPAPSFARLVAQPFHQLGKGREPRKMTPELQSHLQVQQQIRQLMEELSPLVDRLLEGAEVQEDMEKLRQRLLEPKIRAAFCQVLRLAVLKDDPGTDIDSALGKHLSCSAFETLKSCFKVALDAADEQNDAWSGRDLMVLAQLYRTEQEGKPVSLLSHVYNHALWNKVTFWEDVLLLSLCEAYAAEAVWRRSLAAGSQFSKPAMTSFLQRFVGYMMAFGISFDQGRNSVAGTLRKNAAFLGQQTVQIYSQLLLSAYEVATPEGTGGQVDSLNVAMTEALPSGGMAPATVDLGGDDFEAVALGVQADFSAEHAVETPSAQGEEATDEEEEKGEETQALRVLAPILVHAQPVQMEIQVPAEKCCVEIPLMVVATALSRGRFRPDAFAFASALAFALAFAPVSATSWHFQNSPGTSFASLAPCGQAMFLGAHPLLPGPRRNDLCWLRTERFNRSKAFLERSTCAAKVVANQASSWLRPITRRKAFSTLGAGIDEKKAFKQCFLKPRAVPSQPRPGQVTDLGK